MKKVFEDIGINIIKIIYEPTAIAIAYRYNNNLLIKNESNVLIFNFTKEICEITVMNIVENNYTILSSCYDLHLGGDDLTDTLTSFLINKFKKEFGFENEDFYDKNNIKLYHSLIRLRKQCEEIKIQLSGMMECDCNITLLNKDFHCTITLCDYEHTCQNIFDRCLNLIEKAIFKSQLKKSDINYILLSGGSSLNINIRKFLIILLKENYYIQIFYLEKK